MADEKTFQNKLFTLLGFFEVEKNVYINENFHFLAPAYFPVFQDGGQKHFRISFLHYLGVFEVDNNVFINENFHFLAPANFPVFQDGGRKNISNI